MTQYTRTYYFDSYDAGGEEWAVFPARMVNGFVGIGQVAITTTQGDVQLLTGHTYPGWGYGVIKKVEVRANCSTSVGPGGALYLRPVFSGGDGDNHSISPTNQYLWSSWFDITNDTNAPSTWTWNDLSTLDCDVDSYLNDGGKGLTVGKVELRVTYEADVYFRIASSTATITLLKPRTIGWGEQREIMPFNFWAGEITVHDVAKESDVISLSGELEDMSYGSMHSLDDIAEADVEITIEGLEDDVFDDGFIIESFSYTVGPSSILWDLTLERT